jgi:outer membrane protein TolC
MMVLKRMIASLALMIALGHPILAGDALTWAECVREARVAGPELAGAQAAVRVAQALYRADASRAKSQVVITAGAGVAGHRDSDGDDDALGGAALEIAGTRTLYSGHRIRGQMDRRLSEIAIAEIRACLIEANLFLELKTCFEDLLYAQEFVPLSVAFVSHRKRGADLVGLRYEAGLESKAAVATARASHQEAVAEATNAWRSLGLAQRCLARRIGRPEGSLVSAEGRLDAGSAPDSMPLDLVRQLPEYRLAAADLARAEAGVTVARSQSHPDVDLVASYTPQSERWSSETTRWFTGLRFKYVFPFGRGDRHGTAAAVAERDRARASLQAIEAKLAGSMEAALAECRNATELLPALIEKVRAAEMRAGLAEEEYAKGRISLINWELAETDWIQKQKALLRARLDACRAHTRWERVINAGGTTTGPTPE